MNTKITTNWALKPFADQIKVLSEDYESYLQGLFERYQLPKNTEQDRIRTLLDWQKIANAEHFVYDYENNEEEIKQFFSHSDLASCPFLTIELGLDFPIIQVPTPFFIEHWTDFVAANGYMGMLCLSENGLFMEFTDDSDYFLFSNFALKGVAV
jgi:hypothetical protein